LAGNQVVVPLLWQVVQLAVVRTWFVVLPDALVPLWQVPQTVAAVKVLWSTLAPIQVLVDLWQVSQVATVNKWVLVLPVAVVPL
jgi:hypothetical protein